MLALVGDACIKSHKNAVQVAHEHMVDWLELNHRGSHLLFRDSKCQLHLYNLATKERKQLLQYVSYVQWVPDSDVIVVRPLPCCIMECSLLQRSWCTPTSW